VSFVPLASAAPLLTVAGVGKSYAEQRVLTDISFTLGAGERLALTGPSGGGKTTLLNCLGGVDRPDDGSIRLREVELTTLSSDGLAQVRRRQIGTIFQFFHLLPTLSAFENIELPLQLLGVAAPERIQRVEALVRRVGLAHRAEALPGQLSGGEQQRVAIARALVHAPSLVLADEPTGNLDSANGATVLALLRELTDESGVALVLVTHSEEAAAICHRRLAVRDGRIVSGS
jgi:putative ABC transport system ATP-binding protein